MDSAADAALRLLERCERFVQRHGRAQAFRLAAFGPRLHPLAGGPHDGRRLQQLLDQQRLIAGTEPAALAVVEAAVDAAARDADLPRTARQRVTVARGLALARLGLYGHARRVLGDLLDEGGLAPEDRSEAEYIRGSCAGYGGDLDGAEAELKVTLRTMGGGDECHAAYVRAALHAMLAFCKGYTGPDPVEAERHARASLAIARHWRITPMLAAPAASLLGLLDMRSAPFEPREAVYRMVAPALAARRIVTTASAALVANWAHTLHRAGRIAEAGAAALDAMRLMEALGHPPRLLPHYASIEDALRAAGEAGAADRVHASWQAGEARDKGRSAPPWFSRRDEPPASEAGYRAELARRADVRREAARALDTDALTGLPRAEHLPEAFAAAQAAAAAGGMPAIVLVADIDGFGAIDRRFGRPVGDHLLREVGRRLAAVPGAFCCRLEADRFVLLNGGGTEPATWIAHVQAAITRATPLIEPGFALSACIGYDVLDAGDPAAALPRAEAALEQARALGPGCISHGRGIGAA